MREINNNSLSSSSSTGSTRNEPSSSLERALNGEIFKLHEVIDTVDKYILSAIENEVCFHTFIIIAQAIL